MDSILSSIHLILGALPYMLGGIGWTALLILGALAVGLVIGVPLAVGQVYGPWPVRRLVGLYVWLFRGVPILVQIYLFYFGILPFLHHLPGLGWLPLESAVVAAVTVLGLTSGAYQSQIFRGSIQSLPAGQFKAARALGMTDFTAIRSIILPQALRLSIPAWSNEYSILLKDSALAFSIGVLEIMSRTRSVAATAHQPLPMALFAGVLYFILTWVGIKALRTLEQKTKIAGYAREGSIT
ncbi:MAG: amino acid ABC transporter permease [Desulfovibrionaceae bacterium]